MHKAAMTFKGDDLYKDFGMEGLSDVSDTSDVNPEEMVKMLKSSSNLDEELFGLPVEESNPHQSSLKTKPKQGGIRGKSTYLDLDNPVGDSSISDEEFAVATKTVDPPKLNKSDDSKLAASGRRAGFSFEEMPDEKPKERHESKSADWLGLKESPAVDRRAGRSSSNPLLSEGKNFGFLDILPRSGKTDESFLKTKKSALLENLFGDDQEDKKQEKSGGYEPSLGGTRRAGKRKEAPSIFATPKDDTEMDWLLGPTVTTLTKSLESKRENPKKEKDPLPNWLGERRPELDKNNPMTFSSPVLISHEPPQTDKPEDGSRHRKENEDKRDSPEPGVERSGSVVGLLTTVESQLGQSMAQHQKNLKSYLKALISEAERVSAKPTAVEEKLEEPQEPKSYLEVNRLAREQESYMQDLKLDIQRLEIQLVQSELKMENLKEIHEIQMANLKAAHKSEISVWEMRLSRTREDLEHLEKDFQKKLEKLKDGENEMERINKEKIETLQAERLADLKQAGDLHRIALEQAASLSVFFGGNKQGGYHLPLKFSQRRYEGSSDPSEREQNLMEKEREIEIIKAQLISEKEALSEERDKEKALKEEREREMRRFTAEIKFKDELMQKENEAEKIHINMLRTQLESLKETVLKEFTELTREKLALAAEKARLDAGCTIQGGLSFDGMQMKAEVGAQLEAAREAREIVEQERRKNLELRQSLDNSYWELKNKEERYKFKEKQLQQLVEDAEFKRKEGTEALDEARKLRETLHGKEKELKKLEEELKEKGEEITRNRLEMEKQGEELDKKKTQLDLLLPELSHQDYLTVNPPKQFMDPRKLIMKLRAEKDLESFLGPGKSYDFTKTLF